MPSEIKAPLAWILESLLCLFTISFLTFQVALIEYIGKDLDESSTEKPHGNSSKNKSKVYKKRDPKINEIIRSMAGMKPKDIQKYLKDMGLVEMDLTSKTVRQVLYYERLKDKKSTKTNKSDLNKY